MAILSGHLVPLLQHRTACVSVAAAGVPQTRHIVCRKFSGETEKPDFSEAFVTKKQIEYPVSDFRNVVARQFGLEFAVDEALPNLMKEFGNNLADKNGEDSWTLPSPEPSLSQAMGRIEYGFAASDFTLRADPEGPLWTSCKNCRVTGFPKMQPIHP